MCVAGLDEDDKVCVTHQGVMCHSDFEESFERMPDVLVKFGPMK